MEATQGNVLTAFLLTLFAGLSTGLGSLVIILSRKPSLRLLSFGLGFSGGVMVFVSLAELLPQSQKMIGEALGEAYGDWIAYACFFGGMGISRLIDALVPEPETNPHEVVPVSELELATSSPGSARAEGLSEAESRSLSRVGIVTALAIALHNVPEGIATMISAVADTTIGVSVAVAVAIHNIPEGMSVAVLVYFATRSRKKAVLFSLASGLAEPLGAILVFALLASFINGTMVGIMLAIVAGIMVFISFDELLPTAREYGKGHMEIAGIILGMAVMALSLALL
jgi:ZIP family zinc transporter